MKRITATMVVVISATTATANTHDTKWDKNDNVYSIVRDGTNLLAGEGSVLIELEKSLLVCYANGDHKGLPDCARDESKFRNALPTYRGHYHAFYGYARDHMDGILALSPEKKQAILDGLHSLTADRQTINDNLTQLHGEGYLLNSESDSSDKPSTDSSNQQQQSGDKH